MLKRKRRLIASIICVLTLIGVSYRLLPRPVHFQITLSKNGHDDFQDVLKTESLSYLSLVNSFKNFRKTEVSLHVKERIADVFRTGYGLTPIKTKDGEQGWMENGVLFRPITDKLSRMKSHKEAEHEHQSDIEYYVPFNRTLFFQGKTALSDESVKPKIILWYYKSPYTKGMASLEKLWLCPEFPCQITTGRRYSRASTAWIMDVKKLQKHPPKRRPDQVAIFHTAGRWKRVEDSWSNQFNWTLTYRPDSDIQFTYGIIRKRPEPLVKDYKSLIAKKSKMAAAFISNCHSKGLRDNYIAEMKKYVKIDIFGKCGKHVCPQRNHTECSEMINTTYKFYLGFENNICDDYISEKLFRYLSLDVILVARGGDGYYRHLPPEIYINTVDFDSPRQLAHRLIYLDQHPAEYEAILREKNKYVSAYEDWLTLTRESTKTVSRVFNYFEAISLCRVCHWIWNLDEHNKTIDNINAWLDKSRCIDPTDI